MFRFLLANGPNLNPLDSCATKGFVARRLDDLAVPTPFIEEHWNNTFAAT